MPASSMRSSTFSSPSSTSSSSASPSLCSQYPSLDCLLPPVRSVCDTHTSTPKLWRARDASSASPPSPTAPAIASCLPRKTPIASTHDSSHDSSTSAAPFEPSAPLPPHATISQALSIAFAAPIEAPLSNLAPSAASIPHVFHTIRSMLPLTPCSSSAQ